MKKLFYILLLLSATIISCKKDTVSEPDPAAGLNKLTEGYAAGAATKIEVYTEETAIYSGYTKLYIALYDSVSGHRIEEAHVQLTPMMDMGTMQHSAPYENPGEKALDHLFTGSVTFIMSSMGGGAWTVKIRVHNHSTDKEGSLIIPVTVAEPAKARIKSFTALHDSAKYFVALLNPSSPKTGINDMELAIYKKISMMSFLPDSSLSVVLTPEMPAMGHGSPNNVNPLHSGAGHYNGKVNFTMTGLWRLNLDFTAGNAVADSTQFFDIEF